MAISGHKTLSEVQRYTADADRKRLAETAMAKRRTRTNCAADDTNTPTQLHKHAEKA